MALIEHLLLLLADASEGVRAGWRAAVPLIWEGHFELGEPHPLASHLGLLLYTLDDYGAAGAFFERALAAAGPDPRTLCGLALCQAAVEDWPAAAVTVAQALALDPTLGPALRLRERAAAALAGTTAS
jgi:hypothetical protein